jgi:hypothetical protein
MTLQDLIARRTSEVLAQQAQEVEKACWRMIADGKLFSRGWRLAIKLDPKTLKQTTLPLAPGDPVPAGFQRVLGP